MTYSEEQEVKQLTDQLLQGVSKVRSRLATSCEVVVCNKNTADKIEKYYTTAEPHHSNHLCGSGVTSGIGRIPITGLRTTFMGMELMVKDKNCINDNTFILVKETAGLYGLPVYKPLAIVGPKPITQYECVIL